MAAVDKKLLRDLGMLGLTFGLGAVAALTPDGARRRVVSSAVRLEGLLRRERAIKRGAILESEELRESVLAHRRSLRELRIQEAFCQGYGIFRRGWPADVTVTGLDHVRAAHSEGRGLILWQMTFLDLTPVFLVLADAGYPVSHLSSEFHRIESRTDTSRRFIAPVLVRGEKRALHERVVIPRSTNPSYLKRLRSIIQDDHGTVSIRGDFTFGQRMIEAPHLDRVMLVPTGAPSLAHRTGAPLLTSAVVRRGELEHEVIIDEPIATPRAGTRREFQHAAIQEFARRLDDRARLHLDSRPILPFLGVP